MECLFKLYESFGVGNKILFILSDESMNIINGSACSKILYDIYKNRHIKSVPFYLTTAYEKYKILMNLE